MYHSIAKQVICGIFPNNRAMIYVIATIFLSTFCDFSKSSNSYFAQQNNVFNVYFVKFSWGWTLISLGGYLFVVSLKRMQDDSDQRKQIKRSLKILARLAIGTAVWYYGTHAFLFVEEQTGVCGVPKYLDKNSCKRNGFFWNGFDISGHCFLLVWCNLVITEEIQALYSKNNVGMKQLSDKMTCEVERKKYSRINMMFFFISILTVIWDVMITCTNMYFHTTSEKFLGTTIAVLFWAVLYQCVYKTHFFNWLSLE